MFRRIIDLFRSRTLIFTLVERELKARYRGSFLGILWSFANPLLLVLVYYVAFKICIRSPIENYTAFLFIGILPWTYFSSSMLEGATSILTGGHYLKKVLFPSEVLPIVAICSNFVHFILGIPILMIVVGAAGKNIHYLYFFVYLPIIVIVQTIFTLSLVILFSALTVHFRDIQHLLMNFITLWFFSTPIIYTADMVPPEVAKLLITLNPMAHIMIAYQDIFFYEREPALNNLGYVAIFSVVFLFISYFVYNRLRDSFVEEV
ncbi:ABC transporter permease [bacterium]|nr:ABC transporter permease [bacterium]